MSKEYTLADFTDIFDYSTGWFSDSSICSLFYQIFKRFPSMKMVKYKVNQDFLKEIKNFISKTMRSIYSSIYIAIILRMKKRKRRRKKIHLQKSYTIASLSARRI